MKRDVRGVTVIELVVVLAIVGILSMIALPRLTSTTTTLAVRAARQEVAASLARARALAIQNGRPARFVRNGNLIAFAVDNSSGSSTIIGESDLGAGHNVTVTALPTDTIVFDPRGLLVQSTLSGVPKIVVTRQGVSDSVCVLGRGKISETQCTLGL